MKNKKTVITCAITGAATKPNETPYLPITPEQIANSALEAAQTGATVAHIHVRNVLNGQPSTNIELYEEVVNRIRLKNKSLIINLTTGPGALFIPHLENPSTAAIGTKMSTASERVRHIETIKPDICSLDLNTMNLQGPGVRLNHIQICKEMIQKIQAVGTKPELEIFDSGDIVCALDLINEGIIKTPALWQLVMGIKYGWTATPDTLMYAHKLLPPNSNWSAFGISRMQMPLVAQTWLLGGHVRVGMEDNIYLSKGVLAKSNAELVKKAVSLIENLGGSIANYDEARSLLGLN